jgi:hypothetical protein
MYFFKSLERAYCWINFCKSYVFCVLLEHFLGVFANLRKATISIVMSVRLSAWNNSAPTGRIFMKFDILGFFENLLDKI